MKAHLTPVIAALVLASCSKKPYGMTPAHSTTTQAMVGKWTIDSVVTIAYDLNGNVLNGSGHVFVDSTNSYFQFNADATWRESLLPDSLADAGLNGQYTVTSDTTFTISGSNRTDEPCRIVSLSDSVFIFSHQRSADFNGMIPGFLQYVFHMSK